MCKYMMDYVNGGHTIDEDGAEGDGKILMDPAPQPLLF